ncbi:sushi domain-containing protein 2 isoform X2 [Brienomyrus brachyistius]|uniref:sushi domain-containing protein 2 isoform X2 n=1 Tax=Brienomyrus brachyistius TaxID=42636 RepID=UPI0020B313EA|nr:sushi domain-containing protein 2 isoform X2 [Brienomyrus brachyistius]
MRNAGWMERPSLGALISLVTCLCTVTALTCEGQCGQQLQACSCHATCLSLGTCCRDYRQFCLEVSPYSGTMFGGTDFVVLNATFPLDSTVKCRFNSDVYTAGYVDVEGRAHCISPLLYETGFVPFEISMDNGVTFNRIGMWLSVHSGKLEAEFKVALGNATQWQYYGTVGVGGNLSLSWKPSQIRASTVNVELWAYREMGEPYSDSWASEWKYLYSLGKGLPNNGSFSFVPEPAESPFSEWELGVVRVSAGSYSDGTRNVHAVWSEDHALAWHLGDAFRRDSVAWATAKCLAWDMLESRLPSFLNETLDCPCTLAQARADTGRFHTDYGCDIEKGSVCTYHPGSVHCVRAIQASPKYAAGQQCCYDATGSQVLTADSIGGSTPDRGHDWGSPPYRRPPRVPGASHWLYDVLSFYYCCLWSDNCQYYFKHRPSSDCRTYQAPKAGVVFGDPHFVTFDGISYTFNGQGEYYLVQAASKGLTIQGRTERVKMENGTLAKAARLSAVSMQEKTSDIIEVRLASQRDHLQLLRNQQVLSFAEQSWMDLSGQIENETSLFTYDSPFLLDTYYFAPKHNPDFVPAFSVPEDPSDPLYAEMSALCSGEGFPLCRFDTLAARSLDMGNATREAFLAHVSVVEDLRPVVSCGWLAPPSNGIKAGTRYLQGATITFSCDTGYILSGSPKRTCQADGQWSGDPTHCVQDNVLGIVLGSVIGSIALVTLIATIVSHSKKQQRKPPEMEGNDI